MRLIVAVNKITCKDPQDPKFDELYFITASGGKSNTTQAFKGIKRNSTLEVGKGIKEENKLIFDDVVDNDSPVLITALEQRAAQDGSKLAQLMEDLARKGVELAKKKFDEKSGNLPEYLFKLGAYLLDNLISAVKFLFRDTPLLTKVITEPYSPDATYPVSYIMKGKSDERPTYDYEIELLVTCRE